MTAPQEQVRVTQADIAAAKAAQVDMLIGGAQGDKEVWRKVEQAFARHRQAAEAEAKAREAALVEALTPSGSTKAAYHGEFSFQLFRGVSDAGIDQYEKVYVPWDTVKEIMAAIAARTGAA